MLTKKKQIRNKKYLFCEKEKQQKSIAIWIGKCRMAAVVGLINRECINDVDYHLN